MRTRIIHILLLIISLIPLHLHADEQKRILFSLLQPTPSWVDLPAILDSKAAPNEIENNTLIPHHELVQGKVYCTQISRDSSGYIKEIKLLNSFQEPIGILTVKRQGSYITSLSLFNDQGKEVSLNTLEYDDQGRVVFHKGKSESRIEYDDYRDLITIYESSGRTLRFKETPLGIHIAHTTTNDGFSIRSLWKQNSDGEVTWEALDDGTSLDPNSFENTTIRTWKKTNRTKESTIQEEGYVDLSTGQEICIRRWETSKNKLIAYGQNGEKLVDIEGQDLHTNKKNSSANIYNKSFDGLGRIDSIFQSNGKQESISYDLFNNPMKLSSSDGSSITFNFSSSGLLEQLKRADGSSAKISYTNDGLPTSITDHKEELLSCSYDSLGRPTSASIKSPTGSIDELHIIYSSLKRLKATSSAKTVSWEYDFFGRVKTIQEDTLKGIQTWNIAYDDLDRLVSVQSHGAINCLTEYTYDLKGRKRKECKTEGEKIVETLWKWNSDQTCLMTMRSVDASYQYLLDSKGRILTASSFSTHGQEQVTYTYEELSSGYVQTARSHRGTTRTRVYSDTEELISEKIADNTLGLLSESFWSERDGLGSASLTERTYRGGSIIGSRKTRWKFGQNRRLESIEIGSETGILRKTLHQYDDKGHLIKKTLPDSTFLTYEYDSFDRLQSIHSSDGTISSTFIYDSDGRLTTAVDRTNGIHVVKNYAADGSLLEDGTNSTLIRADRNANKQITSLYLPDDTSIAFRDDLIECSYRGKVLFREQRPTNISIPSPSNPFLDPLLIPRSWKESGGAIQYQFDTFGQLEKEPAESQKFCALGYLIERDGVAVERDVEGRMVRCGSESYGYDKRGNLHSISTSEGTTTFTYDALDRLTKITNSRGDLEKYSYDAFHRKRTIEKIRNNKKTTLDLLWFGFEEIGSLSNGKLHDLKIATYDSPSIAHTIGVVTPKGVYHTVTNQQGSIISYTGEAAGTISYSAFGTADKKSPLPWGFMGKRTVNIVRGWDFGARLYLPKTRAWTSHDPLGLTQGKNSMAFLNNCPLGKVELFGLFSWSFNDLTKHIWEAVESVFWKSIRSITFAKQQLDWFNEFRSHAEDVAFRVVSRSYLTLIGYNPDSTIAGTYGSRELTKNVRITQINGILNDFIDITGHADTISDLHGGVPVHYVYSASDGFTGDILRSLFSKVGFLSRQAQLLVKTWKKLINELGGPGKGGLIIHYAHSLGGTDTQSALSYLTPEERKMIKVFTFGSPTLVADNSCQSVMNYVSLKDGIPILSGLDYLKAFLGWREDVTFVESNTTMPLIDHFLSGETYRRILEELGRKFQEEHLRHEGTRNPLKGAESPWY